jgi:alginate O-acetyltransferase complex protein AlgI
MPFDSPVYLVFLPLVVLGYWRLDRRRQNWFLLAASYLFYGWWDWRFLLLMMGSTVIDFLIARRIGAISNPRQRRKLLILSLAINFGVLGFFKYFDFFADSVAHSMALLGAEPASVHFFQIILPAGISFYTFQEVAYIVDVYFEKLPAAESLVDYALFISLFPHLIAGPIQRPSHLLPQVQHERAFKSEGFFDGCMLIVSGLFRKSVIADQCALVANGCFDGSFGHGIPVTVLGAVAFAFQIYGDFSGYSDLARGSAQLLGFHFMVNFRQPYLATSLQDFWRRWHISLSTWLRDYLYIPLGGNRHGSLQTYRNLMLTMLLGGLWHGANWTFVIWGGLHGLGLSAERVSRAESGHAAGIELWGRRLGTFAIVCFAWVLFRARSVTEAFRLVSDLSLGAWSPEIGAATIVVAAVAAIAIFMDLRLERYQEEYVFQSAAPQRRLALAAGLLVVLFLFSASDSNAFIYFQF